MKPLIILSHKLSENSYTLGSAYCSAIARSGGLPLISANGDAVEMAAVADGLLLTGGCDIEPCRYGEEPNGVKTVSTALDLMELELFEAFRSAGKPIMGICRGIQLINVALGGSLVQDIPTQVRLSAHAPVYAEATRFHGVTAEPDSIVGRLFGERFTVNSYHHQAAKRLGTGLRITAQTDEGIVEAVEHRELPIFAVQWHPERMLSDTEHDGPDMTALFDYFIGQCR